MFYEYKHKVQVLYIRWKGKGGQDMLEKFLNFILRGLMGLCTIFVVNHFVITDFPLCDVGMNLFTFLTSGLLGIPGVCALYAINFYVLL